MGAHYNGASLLHRGASMSTVQQLPQAYPDIVGVKPVEPTFEPYIPAQTELRELTPVPVVMGTILGMIFGASSLYLVLKVGLTVSASIPVAVISVALFRVFSKYGRFLFTWGSRIIAVAIGIAAADASLRTYAQPGAP